MRKITNNFFSNDVIVTGIYFFLILVGFISIFSSEFSNDVEVFSIKNESFKQLIWISLCLVIFFSISILEYRFIFDLAVPLYSISLILLVLVMFFGQEVNNHSSWFNFFGFKFQPSEFSKFSTALLLAKIFDSYTINLRNLKHISLIITIIITPALLILMQGFFICVFLLGLFLDINILYVIFTVLFLVVLGLSIKNIQRITNATIFFILTLVIINGQDFVMTNLLTPKQKLRVETLLNPNADPLGAGWNITQSKIAIGSGGILGKGLLQGTQTGLNFVPIQSTDFIFSVIGEEFGYVGSMIFIILYLIFLYRVLILSENQKDKFARVFGYCTFSIIFFHFSVNISMTLGLFPVIGIPLPFISYGGSSLLSFSLLVFVFLKLNSIKPSLLSR